MPIPSPEELLQMEVAENSRLRARADELEAACSSIANIALSFAQLLVEAGIQQAGDRTVVVPKELTERMVGTNITLAQNAAGDVLVRIRERGGWGIGLE